MRADPVRKKYNASKVEKLDSAPINVFKKFPKMYTYIIYI
jgi:hypothetical protein